MFVFVNYILEEWYNGLSGLRYYNSGRNSPISDYWTTGLIKACDINPMLMHPINITSVFGSSKLINSGRRGLNIFYTGENIYQDVYNRYRESLSRQSFDLTIGFDYNDREDYVRFPYWILEHFRPDSTFDDVKKKIQLLRQPLLTDRERFCCLISRHDRNGTRTKIANVLSQYGTIDYAGTFNNNTDELQRLFSDNKKEYMRQYLFNICPENSNAQGYVTEKLFDAFESGCIPVYWGSENNPEPEIINKDAILFYDDGDNGKSLEKKVAELMTSKSAYQDFIHTDRLQAHAEELVWQYIEDLKMKIIELYKNT